MDLHCINMYVFFFFARFVRLKKTEKYYPQISIHSLMHSYIYLSIKNGDLTKLLDILFVTETV